MSEHLAEATETGHKALVWWNPAVEAIDRTHRPGQTRPVLAYRLIAQNTVEDEILELQAGKRASAAEIFADDGGGLSGVSAADLELLFW